MADLEPGTAHPLQRLRAVRDLVDAGVNAGVLMAPIVPGFSSSMSKLERTIKAIADHGARFVGCNVMYLQDGTRSHFMKFIEREFPSMLPRFERLYVKKYPPDAYRKEVQAMVRTLQQRYGVTRREEAQQTPSRTEHLCGAGAGWIRVVGKERELGQEGRGGAGGEQEAGFRFQDFQISDFSSAPGETLHQPVAELHAFENHVCWMRSSRPWARMSSTSSNIPDTPYTGNARLAEIDRVGGAGAHRGNDRHYLATSRAVVRSIRTEHLRRKR